jgi:hypothetical protein
VSAGFALTKNMFAMATTTALVQRMNKIVQSSILAQMTPDVNSYALQLTRTKKSALVNLDLYYNQMAESEFFFRSLLLTL